MLPKSLKNGSPLPPNRAAGDRLFSMNAWILRTSSLWLTATLTALTASGVSLGDDVDFDGDIRPILSENCSFCHGPDADRREADLRLDTHEGALTVITEGARDSSELFDRITTDDVDLLMPPPDSNRKLSADQIEKLGLWIDGGAKWTKHWSFRPLEKPAVPKVAENKHPIRNPIDAFARRVQFEHDIQPAPEADRATLIRRLSLDLRGLPPSPDEVKKFVEDDNPSAYENLVKRLIDSPAYGQRMAWDWLDAARYADTNGYQGDRERTMWPWRDWVVKAFNDNMPYDQFTIQQLAGDLLPEATQEQKLATGFCRNHMINGEGGRIAEENRVEYVMDMTETMGTIWLGLTLNCCRCHDHKYDPITNEEYYQLFAIFNQTPVAGNGGDPQMAPNLEMPSAEQAKRHADTVAELAELDKTLAEMSRQLAKQQPEWEQERTRQLQTATTWSTWKPESAYAKQRLKVQSDNSILASGPNPANDTYTLAGNSPLKTITGLRLEALKHSTMTSGGLARSNSGNFVLTDMKIQLVGPDESSRTEIIVKSATATFEQGGLKVTGVFDDDPKSGWAVYEGKPIDRNHAAVFVFAKPVVVPENHQLEVVLRHDSKHENHNLGHFRVSWTDVDTPRLSSEKDQLIADLKTSPDDRTGEVKRRIAKAHRESDPEYKELNAKRQRLAKRRDDIKRSYPKVMVMADRAKPRETFVLDRGLYNKPKDPVAAGFPEFLPSPNSNDQPTNRLSLARWLVSNDNPLTARVVVNRFWQQVFGIGLVKTPEDFGRQGEIPEHMDLLNWLAADFRDSGWDVKHLMTTIVTSHVYRQSSRIKTRADFERDPANRLLARGARYRMPSWMLRDQALSVSGLLSTVGSGPSVNTYQPAGIWEEASFGKKRYAQDAGEKLYRRSLYVFWRRIVAPTMFFDSATRQTCTVKSTRTNTPLQALQLLNNVAFVEAARVLAEVALKSRADNDLERLDFVMQRVLGRDASKPERMILLKGLERTRSQFAKDNEAAANLIDAGQSSRDKSWTRWNMQVGPHCVWPF